MFDRPFRLKINGLRQSLSVVSFCGTEAISQPFVFTLEVVCERGELVPAKLMYQSAWLALGDADSGVHGQIHAVVRNHYGVGPASYRLTLGPRLACLAQRYTPRVFQHMDATQIITRVLVGHGIRMDRFRFHLKAPCAQRQFCAQYGENDLMFVQRLCAEEGIHYHFVHSPQGHELVFGSGLHGVRRAPEAPWCTDDHNAGITRFSLCHASTAPQELRAPLVAEGHSTLAWLGCGQLLPVSGHPQEACNHLWRVTHVEHYGERCGDSGYRNRFVALPWAAPVQIPPVPAVVLPALQRAWTVGSPGQLAERDAAGRVRVQLEWVRQGNGGRFAECWLPVADSVRGELCGEMMVIVGESDEPGMEPPVIACPELEAVQPSETGASPAQIQARFDAGWLLDEQRTLQVVEGPQLHLTEGCTLAVQVGDSQVSLDANGWLLSAPSLTFTVSAHEPAIVAAQAPGHAAQAQAAQQGEEQEGQP